MGTKATSGGNMPGSPLGVLGPSQTSFRMFWHPPELRLFLGPTLPPRSRSIFSQETFASLSCGDKERSLYILNSPIQPQHGSWSRKAKKGGEGAKSRQWGLPH